MAIDDHALMARAIVAADDARRHAPPNPWVGCAIATTSGSIVTGSTRPPGGPHAEIEALAATGGRAQGSTLATTLEPCSHTGRTGPCTSAIIDAGVARVVVSIEDPDPRVAGTGIAALRAAGIEVNVGVEADTVTEQLAPYLHHRRTGRPYVVAKMAATLDGRTAAPDLTSQWITGEAARRDVHRLRSESQAILVGAGTVRTDDPQLTVRHVEGNDPRRIVLGTAPPEAKVHPCLEWRGELGTLLDELGDDGVLQLMVEGGASTISQFHAEGLLDRLVVYLAPALFGGDDARPMFAGDGASTMAELLRGRFVAVTRLDDDLRIDFEPRR
ncbi:MAG: bifunctional diaminohydroxyphosphoribosylaminopyrimidine deaminase/5-amino-6-(5-phosphoribosylamino)uracil reductase RibD [Actinomycetota bacterium]